MSKESSIGKIHDVRDNDIEVIHAVVDKITNIPVKIIYHKESKDVYFEVGNFQTYINNSVDILANNMFDFNDEVKEAEILTNKPGKVGTALSKNDILIAYQHIFFNILREIEENLTTTEIEIKSMFLKSSEEIH